jgi:hypothetical protein
MNMLPSTRRLSLSLGLLIAVAGGFAVLAASTGLGPASAAAPPSATATAAAAPAASASAAPSGSASAAPAEPPLLRGADIPKETSDAPKPKAFGDEWMTIGKAYRTNTGERGSFCKLTLVREWLRLRCEDRIGATMFTGDPTGVKIWPVDDRGTAVTTIILPLRRGETRMFNLLGIEQGYEWSSMADAERIAVIWREDQEDPVVLVSGF